MTPRLQYRLRVLLLREGATWVAQCLEYDIAAQGSTIAEAQEALVRTLAGYARRGLSSLSPAPGQYWEQFEIAEQAVSRQGVTGVLSVYI